MRSVSQTRLANEYATSVTFAARALARPVSPRPSAPFDLRKSAVHSNTDRLLRHSMNTESAHYHSFNITPATATAKTDLPGNDVTDTKAHKRTPAREGRAQIHIYTKYCNICTNTQTSLGSLCVHRVWLYSSYFKLETGFVRWLQIMELLLVFQMAMELRCTLTRTATGQAATPS